MFRALKWRIAPGAAAATIGLVAATALFLTGVLAIGALHRVHMAQAEWGGAYCRSTTHPSRARDVFPTSSMCWPTGLRVAAGKRYQLVLRVTQPWRDGPIAASPAAFGTERFPFLLRFPAVLLRRSINDPWFRPLFRVRGHKSGPGALGSVRMQLSDESRQVYVGEFVAPASGELLVAVNDAVLLWGRPLGIAPDYFYSGRSTAHQAGASDPRVGNRGLAELQVRACDAPDASYVCGFD